MKKEKKSGKALKAIAIILAILILAALGIGYYFTRTPLLNEEETQYLYIDRNDNIDSVMQNTTFEYIQASVAETQILEVYEHA